MDILVVEDNAEIRDALVALLRDEGYQAAGASNGKEALELLTAMARPPSLILLDLMMPGMDGAAFRKQQQQDPRFALIPTVVVTADRNGRGKISGTEAYLSKPF